MIRFTLRQFRTSGALALGALVALAVVLLITGPHLVHLYDTVVANCSTVGDCNSVTSSFLDSDRGLRIAGDAFAIVVPCLIGLFWGAPLVSHELEAGTYRLAWTQGVTRQRWLALKLGILGVASITTAGLLSWIVTWWSSPIDRVNMDVFTTFDQRDIVPIGYAAFAFVLGVAAGILIRRTLPAMATTLVTFVVARVAIVHWVRPHLVTPVTLSSAIDPNAMALGSTNGGPITVQAGGPNIPNAWVYSTQFVNKAGHVVSSSIATKVCPDLGVGRRVRNLPGSGNQSRAPPSISNIQSALQSLYRQAARFLPPGHDLSTRAATTGRCSGWSLGSTSPCPSRW